MLPARSPPCCPFHPLHTSKCIQGMSHSHTEMMRKEEEKMELPIQPHLLDLSPNRARWRREVRVEEVDLPPCPCFGVLGVDQIRTTSVYCHSQSGLQSFPHIPPPQYLSSPSPPPSSAGATLAQPPPGPPQGRRSRSGQGRPRTGAGLHFLEAQEEVGEKSPGKVCEIVEVKQQSWWGRRKLTKLRNTSAFSLT